jgi:hypothetical protein
MVALSSIGMPDADAGMPIIPAGIAVAPLMSSTLSKRTNKLGSYLRNNGIAEHTALIHCAG